VGGGEKEWLVRRVLLWWSRDCPRASSAPSSCWPKRNGSFTGFPLCPLTGSSQTILTLPSWLVLPYLHLWASELDVQSECWMWAHNHLDMSRISCLIPAVPCQITASSCGCTPGACLSEKGVWRSPFLGGWL